MKKQIISIMLIFAIAFSLCMPTFAEARANRISPSLSFSGDTANCSVTVVSADQYIDVTLELWEEETLIASWPESGTHFVGISQTYPAISGWRYTLKVVGTIGGDPIDVDPIIGICPLTRSTP